MSWDDLSGAETQPWSAIKSWAVLTDMERAAAAVLGYGAITWDNDSGNEPQPISMEKRWSELSSCVGGENLALRCWLCNWHPYCKNLNNCTVFVRIALCLVRIHHIWV